MQSTAMVTGGTRGLGRAISIALKDEGYRVAATYHSNDASAHSFQTETGIPIFKWDVADFEACRVGTAAVMQELGSIEVLVNNAGITADATLKNMSSDMWWRVINTNLGSVFNMSRNVIEHMRSIRFGRIVNITSVNGSNGSNGSDQLLRIESWHHRIHQGPCTRRGPQWHHGKLRRSWVLFNGDGGCGA
jgi:acetoacetyl-CoA reductase